MAAARIALVIIFNHRFDQNIERLDEYYAPRFSRRKYLVPFAPWNHPSAIRVVENGWNFSGHIAQAAADFIDDGITHYVFAADDLILNPRIDEHTILGALGLSGDEGHIKSLTPLWQVCFAWHHGALAAAALLQPGFDYERELPPPEEVRAKFDALGLPSGTVKPRNLREALSALQHGIRAPIWLLRLLSIFRRETRYPLLAGYSDFFVVPAGVIRQFAHYCGVFSAANIFAEVAIPTALALACDRVRTELVTGDFFFDSNARTDQEVTGKELWNDDIARFGEALQYDWNRLLAEFPPDRLYIHPIKLTKWK